MVTLGGAAGRLGAVLGVKQKAPDISAFANNEVQRSKNLASPGVEARMEIQGPAISQAPAALGLSGKLRDYSSWSRNITNQQFAQRQAARAAAHTQARQTPQGSNGALAGAVAGAYGGPGLKDAESVMAYSRGSSPLRQKIVSTALQYVADKTPYAWGGGGAGVRTSRGTGKGTQNIVGVDCSGLVAYAYSRIGVNLPHYSGSQTAMGFKTNIKNAQPGDIVGWNKGGHVAVYVGNGMIAEAAGVGKGTRVRAIRPGEAVYAVRLKLQGE